MIALGPWEGSLLPAPCSCSLQVSPASQEDKVLADVAIDSLLSNEHQLSTH